MDKKVPRPKASRPDLKAVKSGPAPAPVVQLVKPPISQGEIIAGRYRVERIVAEGGMGIIVAAKHIELEENVAIKFLRDEFAQKPEIVGRFAREAKAAAKIKSTYTATVHDVGISEDRGPFIVMEYLEGEDLEVVLQSDGRIPYARAAEYIMQAGEALAAAHAAGIIHRDVKPANLFLVKSDHNVPIIKVLDFGVSKTALTGNVFGGAISLVKTQSLLVGSPIYMSPEQLRGTQEVGFTSDVWSLGAVLYELITGETAFTGSSITELCAAVLESTPQSIRTRAPEAPPELEEVVMTCLEKDPKKRYQTVAEVVVALARFAPVRARMSVDRVIALSKAAGLLAQSYEPPEALMPPVIMSLMPPSPSLAPQASPPQSLLETVMERDEEEAAAVSASEPTAPRSMPPRVSQTSEVAPKPRWPMFIAGGLVVGALALGGRWLAKDAPVAQPAPPTPTAAAAAPTMVGVPTMTTPAATDSAAAAATDNKAEKAEKAEKKATAKITPPATTKAAAKASAVNPAPPAAPAPVKSENVRSAIDDRK